MAYLFSYFRIMRTVVLVVFLGFTSAYGQPNQYFQHNPVWTCYRSNTAIWPYHIEENYNYYVRGDTVIGAFTYKQVFIKGTHSYQPMLGSGGSSDYLRPNPSFFLRSTSDRRIYIMPYGAGEYELYNFQATGIGDTVFYYPPYIDYFQEPDIVGNATPRVDAVVTAMDSIYADGMYLRRFTTWVDFSELIFVEGVGHNHGLLEPVMNLIEIQHEHICYSANDTLWTVFGSSPGVAGTCEMEVSLSGVDEAGILYGWNIYPNPASDHVYIDQPSSSQLFGIRVFNTLGQCIISTTASASPFQLDVNGLPPGIYIVHIQFAQGEFQHRFMKY